MDKLWITTLFCILVTNFLWDTSDAQVCTKTLTRTKTVLRPQTYTVIRSSGSGHVIQVLTRQVSQIEATTRNLTRCCAGYFMKRKKCEPICEQTCMNSKCVAPNTCKCFEGYRQFNPYRCLPYCENCQHGRCSGPNICDCDVGYDSDDKGSCKPVCTQQCINGFCSRPNTCSCNDGYEPVEGSSSECKPKCKHPCQNGVCSAPEQCSCRDGYHLNVSRDPYTCVPKCLQDCLNGLCVAPDVCVCNKGFRLSPKSGRCEEIPTTTITPKQMSTEEIEGSSQGFLEDILDYHTESEVEEYQTESDVEEYQTESDVEEYQTESDAEEYHTESDAEEIPPEIAPTRINVHLLNGVPQGRVFVLDSGEVNLGHRNIRNDCDPKCIGGDCLNGTCLCYEGFVQVDINECASKCEKSCQNGECDEDGVCQCLKGYELNSDNECTPNCFVDCINGYCIEPNLCECFQGYILDESSDGSNRCIPLCNHDDEHGCINGTCIAPNKCKCPPGFILSSLNKFLCIPYPFNVPDFDFNHEMYTQESKLGVYAFYLAVVLLVAFVVAMAHYYTKRKYRKKDYHVGYNENRFGTVAYSIEKNNLFIA